MELYKALKTIVDLQGVDILKDLRLVNILSDFKAYDDFPAAKFVIKNMINEDFMAKLLGEYEANTNPDIVVNSNISMLSDTYGYKIEIADYLIKSIAYALGWIDAAPSGTSMPNEATHETDNQERHVEIKDDGKHLLFKNIPIAGDINDFIGQLQSIGYELEQPFNPVYKLAVLRGSFAGNTDCAIVAFSTPKSHLTKGVMIHLREHQVWYNLKDQYEKIKSQLSKKYGTPESYEYFLDPYYEGDGYELTALGSDHCTYSSTFELENGKVILFLTSDAKVSIMYQDKINAEIADVEEESIADDDF